MPSDREFSYEKDAREFSYREPIEIVRRTHGRSSWQTDSAHTVWRKLYRKDADLRFLSGVAFDNSWDCETCRPSLVKAWRHRIREAEWTEMHLDLVPAPARRRMTDRLRSSRTNYVAIPLLSRVAFLTTGPGSNNADAVAVEERGWLVERLLAIKHSRSRIGSTTGFLPETKEEGYEAFHKGSSPPRMCGHLHVDQADAKECAITTGLDLDGDISGWYVRRTSGIRTVGTLSTSERESVVKCLETYRIVYEERLVGGPFDLELEPMSWSDPRFVKLRSQLGFKPSRPFELTDESLLIPRIHEDGRLVITAGAGL